MQQILTTAAVIVGTVVMVAGGVYVVAECARVVCGMAVEIKQDWRRKH